jgi:hypothetical protein
MQKVISKSHTLFVNSLEYRFNRSLREPQSKYSYEKIT